MLAPRFPVVSPALHTFIRVKPGATIIVMDGEPTATAGTDDQTGEVRCPAPRYSHGVGAGTVGLQPRLVAFILLQGNVGRAVIGQQDQPLVRRHHHTTSAWSLQLLATGIFLSSPVDVGARIEGMLEHGL